MRLVRYIPAVVMALTALLPVTARAHSPFISDAEERLPLLLGGLLLLMLWAGYCLGARRTKTTRSRLWTFQAAILATGLTTFGPLDAAAESSTAIHMLQHMLMMTLIPSLWVLARPLPQWTAVVGRPVIRLWALLSPIVRRPLAAASLHAAIIWFWHAPKPYILALDNAWWHAAEHAGFLLSAGLLWWSILRCGRRGSPKALLALLFTLMHTGLLGALLTFAGSPLYGAERNLPSQQLAGLIMWVAGGLPYLAAAAWCGLRWLPQMGAPPARPTTVNSPSIFKRPHSN